MSKSVLVIDTPESCTECKIGHDMSGYMEVCIICQIANKVTLNDEAESRPDWCPLKPLPEKKEYIVSIDNVESQKDIIAVGWNSCIDAITGKVKQMEILTEKERNIDGTELNLEEKETDKEVQE